LQCTTTNRSPGFRLSHSRSTLHPASAVPLGVSHTRSWRQSRSPTLPRLPQPAHQQSVHAQPPKPFMPAVPALGLVSGTVSSSSDSAQHQCAPAMAAPNGCLIEARWLVHGGHAASLRQPLWVQMLLHLLRDRLELCQERGFLLLPRRGRGRGVRSSQGGEAVLQAAECPGVPGFRVRAVQAFLSSIP
jgi:hypothetical protein